MTSGESRHSSWWVIPIAVVIGATAMFLAVAAPHWTKQPALPSAITVRPDAQSTAVGHAKHHNGHGHRNGGHHPHPTPTPTPTVTVTSIGPSVTVVTPKRAVVTATPEPDDRGNGSGGANDNGHDDSGGHHRDN